MTFVLSSCAAEPDGSYGDGTSVTLSELEISAHATGGSCSTIVARGLTEQLVAEMNCIRPGALARIDGMPGIHLSSAARAAPYLQGEAAAALRRAGRRGPGSLSVTSALRTLPQQYLLRRWYERRRCGIAAAARPGRSNHESGLAVDVSRSELSGWRSTLEREGFDWFGSGDPVHFDYRGAGSVTNLSVLAFQRLWNRNNPRDRIGEDGVYGPATEARLGRSPAEGFRIGACGGWASPDAGAFEPDAGTPDPGDPDPGVTEDPPSSCGAVTASCDSDSACCGALSCRRGVTFGTRCCAESGTACSSGSDCCGYMSCVSGRCTCRGSGRACLDDGDCCSGDCASGTCR